MPLVALLLLCVGPHFFKTGFYLDDWALIARASVDGRPDLLHAFKAFSAGPFWFRPMEIIHYPLIIWIGGLVPWKYRLMGLFLEAGLGGFIFLLLKRLTGNAYLALTAAALALVFPNHRSTHIWMTNTVPVAAFTLLFMSLYAHSRGRSSPRGLWRAAGQVCYVLAALEYEAVMLLPALLWAAWTMEGIERGRGRYVSAQSALRDCAPYGLSLVFVLVYKRVLVPGLIGVEAPSLPLSAGHLWNVYRAALACATSEVALLFWESLRRSALLLGPALWMLLIAGTFGLAFRMDARRAGERETVSGVRILLASSLAAFIAAYLPFFATGVYTPRMYGVMNRINLGGGIAAGMALAALLACLPRSLRGYPLRVPVLTLCLSVCVVCHWDAGLQWSLAWDRQREILADIGAQLPPGPATIVIVRSPPWISGGPVFKTMYDITKALMLTTGRSDVRGDVAFRGWLKKEEMVVLNGDRLTHRYPYENLYVYNGERRKLYPVAGETSNLGF